MAGCGHADSWDDRDHRRVGYDPCYVGPRDGARRGVDREHGDTGPPHQFATLTDHLLPGPTDDPLGTRPLGGVSRPRTWIHPDRHEYGGRNPRADGRKGPDL